MTTVEHDKRSIWQPWNKTNVVYDNREAGTRQNKYGTNVGLDKCRTGQTWERQPYDKTNLRKTTIWHDKRRIGQA